MADKESRRRILLVDDAPDTLEVLQRNLAMEGYMVITAPGVEEACRILDTDTFDLVITDYKMPKVTGLDLVRHVRENFKDTGIMMITGYASINGAVEAVKSGAEDYLAKPFTEKELTGAVKRALEKLDARRTLDTGSADATGFRRHRKGRIDTGDRAHYRRERNRQGIGGARRSL